MRINKFLAEAGVCSRRKADELILAGLVRVNGIPVSSPGLQIDGQTDCIEINGRRIALSGNVPCCIMLNKPSHVICTAHDPEGRTTVLDLIPKELTHAGGRMRRLYPAGRLDFFSEGLILITDDGELTQRLIHPRHHIPKTYHVTIRGSIAAKQLRIMREGMTLAEGEKLAPVDVSVKQVSEKGNRTVLKMILHQGVNRQIRRMCRDLGLTVLRLVRVEQGPLRLGNLPSGTARLLTSEELSALRQAAGLSMHTS